MLTGGARIRQTQAANPSNQDARRTWLLVTIWILLMPKLSRITFEDVTS